MLFMHFFSIFSCYNCLLFFPLVFISLFAFLQPADMERQHLVPFDEDEEDQCIQLLSFCPKHRPSSNERLAFDERIEHNTCEHVDYVLPANPSGCARSGMFFVAFSAFFNK